MIKRERIRLGTGQITGYRIDLGNAPLLLLQAKKGYVMCGYLNMSTANKLGDIAGRVIGVKTLQDVLNAKVIEVSENAKKEGLTEGMNVKEFLIKLL
jgi:uncharacterized protein YunC (DUF1805 family)